MFIPSEIILKPQASKTYLRLMLVCTFFSILLLFDTSIFFSLKLCLLSLLLWQLKKAYTQPSACPSILELRGTSKDWILFFKEGTTEQYEQGEILFSNGLFILLKLSNSELNTKRWVVLFNDQLPQSQIRLLHLRVNLKI